MSYPTWKCLTCHRTGTDIPVPARCPSCNSESDDRHGPIALTVQITEQCTLRLAVSVTSEDREALLRKARALRPAGQRRNRPHDYARARRLADESATERLTADRAAYEGATKWYVRVYYRSMGDEILCFDAGPMGRAAATALESECSAPGSLALGADGYTTDPDNAQRMYPEARLVVLPSQRAEPAEIVHDEPDCAASMGCLCACHAAGMSADEPCDTSERRARMIADPDFEPDPEPVPAPRRIFNTYHAEAMAKRAARFQTMHRRAIAA